MYNFSSSHLLPIYVLQQTHLLTHFNILNKQFPYLVSFLIFINTYTFTYLVIFLSCNLYIYLPNHLLQMYILQINIFLQFSSLYPKKTYIFTYIVSFLTFSLPIRRSLSFSILKHTYLFT